MRLIIDGNGFVSRNRRNLVEHVAASTTTADDRYVSPFEVPCLSKLANPWHKREKRAKDDKSCGSG